MKRMWFAFWIAMAIPACMDTTAQPGSAELLDSAAPASEISTSELGASPMPSDLTCRQQCAEAYETCLGNATDGESECQCYNSDVGCRRRCGDHDPFIQC